MARKGQAVVAAEVPEARMNIVTREEDEQVKAALTMYGFEGYTVERLVAEGSLRAKRFVEDVLELGRIVLALRDMPHGTYLHAVDAMGIPERTARRVAGVARKFWNRDQLKPVLSLDIGKVYELALLDDDTLEEIAADPQKLDVFDRMSVSQLRRAARDMRGQIEAKDKVAENHMRTIQRLKEKQARTPQPTPEFLAQETLNDLQTTATECAAHIAADLRRAIVRADELVADDGQDTAIVRQAVSNALALVFAAARQLVDDFGIDPHALDTQAEDPSWAAVRAQLAAEDAGAAASAGASHAHAG